MLKDLIPLPLIEHLFSNPSNEATTNDLFCTSLIGGVNPRVQHGLLSCLLPRSRTSCAGLLCLFVFVFSKCIVLSWPAILLITQFSGIMFRSFVFVFVFLVFYPAVFCADAAQAAMLLIYQTFYILTQFLIGTDIFSCPQYEFEPLEHETPSISTKQVISPKHLNPQNR